MDASSGELMNVREAARYLGINEKKIYFLAKAGQIPSTRVTGKWTFPKKLIDEWIEGSASGAGTKAPALPNRAFLLAAGSDDPCLGILHDLYERETRSASFYMTTVGSGSGVAAIRSGVADCATAHLLEPARNGGRKTAPPAFTPVDTVIVGLFYRELGLLVAPGNPKGVDSIRDLVRPGMRLINRQPGSGTRIYLDQQLVQARLNPKRISGYDITVSTHFDVGLRILRGDADAGLGTRTTAQLLGLEFRPLIRERFDLWIPRERFFTDGIQTLLGVIGSREFRASVDALGGYDLSESGRIIHRN
ncbi:MAG TPA: substrate-binding domain-containing protein [Candidatus Binatia bacterium]